MFRVVVKAAKEGFRCPIGRRAWTRDLMSAFGITTCQSMRKTPFPKGCGSGSVIRLEHTSRVVPWSNCVGCG